LKRFAAVLSLAAGLGLAGGAHAAGAVSSAHGQYKIVIQVTENDPRSWNLALNNAMAFQRNVGEGNSEIEIVAIGPGLNMLRSESKATARIEQALDKSIDVIACGETMHAMKLSKNDLIGGVRVVPGGLIEIANREREGWIYYRP
jgi:intracellular sulfur oxidation DsrE/DsrF family protein